MDLEQKAIARLRLAAEMSETYYGQPLVLTTSGGKDSDVCLYLAAASGIHYEVMHSHTSVDAPETVYHVRKQFRRLELAGVKCTINYPQYPTKADAAHKNGAVLLLGSERKWRHRPHDRDRRPLGGKRQPSKEARYLREYAA